MRKITKKVMVGDVEIGGGTPISIQSMTNTDTRDIKATIEQIKKLEDAGCQIVRCAVPDMDAACAIEIIKKNINIPIVADIHFDYRLAVKSIYMGADKVRINPGNIGSRENIEAVVKAAKDFNIPLRIGVNAGSLEKEVALKSGVNSKGLVESALSNIKILEDLDFDNIVVSLKSSDVIENYEAHIMISNLINYPLHIGITESGTVEGGKLKSAIGVGSLLLAGIGDTMRISLTGDPVNEIQLAKDILKSTGIRKEGISLISCPTCGRCKVDLCAITTKLENMLKDVEKEMPLGSHISVAVMGCEVNGPGEAREADIGVAFGKEKGTLFKKGKIVRTINEEEIYKILTDEIIQLT